MWRYKFTRHDLMLGTKHEMEHTKVRGKAKQIALDHLREHPSYYRVLPISEKVMIGWDRKMAKARRRR